MNLRRYFEEDGERGQEGDRQVKAAKETERETNRGRGGEGGGGVWCI